jgi:tetratricopeptide (TPR) repeat protein
MRIKFALPAFLLIAFVVFFPSLNGEFIMDDWGYITQNPHITDSLSPLHFWLSFKSGPDFWPLSYTFYWIFFRLFGNNPLGYHIVNVVMHAMNAVLVMLVARHFAPRKAPWAALLFLVHPLQVQAVSWIIQFKTLLSTQLALITILLYLRGLFVPALATFALSLLAKTSTMFLPFAMVFLEWDRTSWRQRLTHLSPFLALAVLGGIATMWSNAVNFTELDAPVFNMAWYQRPLLVFQNVLFYLGSFFWPYRLSFIYPYMVPNVFAWALGLFAIVALLIAMAMTRVPWLRGSRRHFLAYLVALLPSLGLIPIPAMKLSLVMDHYAYFPHVFLAIWAAVILEKIPWRIVANSIAAAAIVVLAIAANRHAATFDTEEIFWRQVLEKNPESAIPNYNLGTAYDKQNRLPEALAQYQEAIRKDPLHGRAFYNMGRTQYMMGNLAGAREGFSEAIRLDPTIVLAYISLSKVQLVLLHKEKAIETARRGLQVNPDNPELIKWLAELQSQDP